MSVLVDVVTDILSTLTLIGGILLLYLIYIVVFKKKNDFLNKHALLFAWIISLCATFGSLFYSEIAGYTPCLLCWYQRIFMYPLIIILGIATYKKDNKIGGYVIPLSMFGGVIAAYHYYTQLLSNALPAGVCAVGEECSRKYVLHYGYITIPIMALTAFLLIIFLTINRGKKII